MDNDIHILVADDDESHLTTLKTIIKSWGYQVSVADDGAAADGYAVEHDRRVADPHIVLDRDATARDTLVADRPRRIIEGVVLGQQVNRRTHGHVATDRHTAAGSKHAPGTNVGSFADR